MVRARVELKRVLQDNRQHVTETLARFARAQRSRGMAWQATNLIRECLFEATRGREVFDIDVQPDAAQWERKPLHPVELAERWLTLTAPQP